MMRWNTGILYQASKEDAERMDGLKEIEGQRMFFPDDVDELYSRICCAPFITIKKFLHWKKKSTF